MTEVQLGRLLAGAAQAAEAAAPPVDPLGALVVARRRREQRRGQVLALAFVAFVLVLQLLPAEAMGASEPGRAATVVAAQTPGPASAGTRGPRG